MDDSIKTTGIIIGAIIIFWALMWALTNSEVTNYIYTSNTKIDGSSYIISAYYNTTANQSILGIVTKYHHTCKIINVNYYTANQTGVHYTNITNQTDVSSIAKYIQCTNYYYS